MKFAFVTCVELGLACIHEIYRIGGELTLVITLDDHIAQQKSGRVYLDAFCQEHGVDLVKVGSINDAQAVEAVTAHQIDWLLIIGWSQIARREVLRAAQKGALGIHPTLLPVGRGRAPIPWAIIRGLDETGVTLFKLDEGVDTGPILVQEVVPIDPAETATTLYKRIEAAHGKLIGRVWPDLVADRLELRPQDESQATEWPKRTPADGEIFASMDCTTVDRLVRGVTHPYPGAFIDLCHSRYRIWAGRVHRDSSMPVLEPIDSSKPLWFALLDGCYEATEWDRET